MAEDKFRRKEEVASAPFNSAVACLMRIDDCLKRFYFASKLEGSDMQIFKKRLAKELIIQASPLLKNENVEELMKEIREIKLKVNSNGFVRFSSEVTDKIDDVVIKTQRYLQEDGRYIMPSTKDPRFTWSQD